MIVVEASIISLFRTLLFIIGAIVIVRFIGQFMTAKRNMEEERRMNENQRRFEKEKKKKKENLGKTRIIGKNRKAGGVVEDVDFEEID